MKRILPVLLLTLSFFSLTSLSNSGTGIIGAGAQPQISVDKGGVARIVYGTADKIWCVTSIDRGLTFSKPVMVAEVKDMHLGMSRGPQLASSKNFSVISAMDKAGNIHWFKLRNTSKKWQDMGIINDQKGSAPEGLMSIAADDQDHFYAAWLDIRTGKHNQIYFSALAGQELKWSKNTMAYQSPDQHVCECCKPSIAVNGSTVAIMFRNWLNGSRDLYVVKSQNQGQSFAVAQKLGVDTWKLNGCPMDGGGLIVNSGNVVQTTWQRKGIVYYCQPGQPEIFIANGRTCSISGTGDNPVLAFQNNDTVKVMTLKNRKEVVVGNGSFLKSVMLPDSKVLCVWEQDNNIKFKKI